MAHLGRGKSCHLLPWKILHFTLLSFAVSQLLPEIKTSIVVHQPVGKNDDGGGDW